LKMLSHLCSVLWLRHSPCALSTFWVTSLCVCFGVKN
jgi:hypothetical protein